MFKVLKMEWFRFRKSRCVYVILIILSLLFLFGTILDSSVGNTVSTVNNENKNSFQLYTEDYDTTYTGQYADKYEMLVSAFSGNIVPMAMLIFAGLFAGAYRKNKFEKNIIGLIGKRQRLVTANIIICAIYSLIIMFVTLSVSFIGYHLFYPDFAKMPDGNLMEFVKYLISYYILLNSVAIIMSCFVQLVGNQIVAIIIGLIYGSGIVYGIIDFISQILGMTSFSIQNYVPLGTLYNLSIDNQEVFLRSILIAVLFGIVSVVINIIVKNKQDIVT